MRKRNTKAWLAAIALTVCSCADNGSKLRSDISRVERGLNDVRSFQAEQTTKISALETELRALVGRVDEMGYRQEQRLGSDLSNLQNDLSNLRRRVPPPPIVPAETLDSDEARLGDLPPELSAPFGQGLQLLREGNFPRAVSYLDEAYHLGMGTQWAPQLIFWRAVAYDGMNEHSKALEGYHELATRYPKNPRASQALLRQASVLIRLGDTKVAKLTLNKILAEFPKSPEAAKARERLKDL